MGGVYIITHIASGNCYIGSSFDITLRFSQHRKLLMRNKHHSPRLQRSWIKYGADAFSFETLELVQDALLLVREQHYIDTLKPAYNVCKIAGSVLGVKHSDATKAKVSAASKKMWQDPKHREKIAPLLSALARAQMSNPAQRQKISDALKGNQNSLGTRHTEETKAKMSAAKAGNKHSLGFKHTPETRAKVSAAKMGANHPAFGKSPSDETRAKLAAAMRVRWAQRKAEQVA